MIYVQSSNLSAVEYDPTRMALRILFHNNRLYEYHGVHESIYNLLLASASKGQFFNSHIKNCYPYHRIY